MKLVLVRGPSGSGKTTFARSPFFSGYVHMETDMFFVDCRGEYVFSDRMLGVAHTWCLARVSEYIRAARDVVVGNTFTRLWEMQPYIALAEFTGAELSVIRLHGDFGNVHGLPQEVVDRQRERFESYPGEVELFLSGVRCRFLSPHSAQENTAWRNMEFIRMVASLVAILVLLVFADAFVRFDGGIGIGTIIGWIVK